VPSQNAKERQVMSEALVFYTNPMSRGRIVRWMLEEIGEPYSTEIVEYGSTMKAPDYLAINPMGKVPAIGHGDQVITETPAIVAYLADTYPGAGLGPRPEERAAYYRWLFFGASSLEAAMFNKAAGMEPPEDKSRALGYGSYDLTVGVLKDVLSGGDFIAGERFTAVDLYLGSQVNFGLRFGLLEKLPEFVAYAERATDRDAYRKATEIDDALLAAKSE
jgi:glutathione S-transferase